MLWGREEQLSAGKETHEGGGDRLEVRVEGVGGQCL